MTDHDGSVNDGWVLEIVDAVAKQIGNEHEKHGVEEFGTVGFVVVDDDGGAREYWERNLIVVDSFDQPKCVDDHDDHVDLCLVLCRYLNRFDDQNCVL